MEKKKFFKNKIQMVIYLIIFALCIVAFIVIGKTDFHINEESKEKKFNAIYKSISSENLYVFSDATEVLNLLKKGSGIVLMGFPNNKWTEPMAAILEEVCENNNIDKIMYYDFLKDRDESNGTYETIVKKLSVYIPTNDLGIQDILAPTILIIKNGEIIEYFDDFYNLRGIIDKEQYFDEFNKNRIYEELNTALIEYNGEYYGE